MRLLALLLLLFTMPPLQADEACPRIISQSPYITHTLEWMGLKPCIVGTTRYEDIGVAQTGGVLDPDVEAIELLRPELIFTSDWIDEQRAKALAPAGSRAIRLHGFQSMHQIEQNMRTIAEAVGRAEVPHAERFHRAWTKLAASIDGGGRRVMLLSSCSGMPYSFGPSSWVYDLFERMNFEVVETHERIRPIRAGEELADLNTAVDELSPQLLFIFERKNAQRCQLITPKLPVRIITLDESLLQPAPVLLKGLEQLAARQSLWN